MTEILTLVHGNERATAVWFHNVPITIAILYVEGGYWR